MNEDDKIIVRVGCTVLIDMTWDELQATRLKSYSIANEGGGHHNEHTIHISEYEFEQFLRFKRGI